MLLLVSGPPVSLVAITSLNAAQTALLTSAMDEREDADSQTRRNRLPAPQQFQVEVKEPWK